MPQRLVTDGDLKGEIMNILFRKGRWGYSYFPLDTLTRWLCKKMNEKGGRIRRLVGELCNDGYLMLWKKGATVSLNPKKSLEIEEYIKTHVFR